jgi:uncharacterized protein (TIGR02246 family)
MTHERHGQDADLTAIDRVREQHVAALNAGDAGAWVAEFADDGVQMPPNAPANIGKAAIAAWSQGFLSHFRVQFALDVDEVRILDEWAFERGDYAIALDPGAGGPPLKDTGKYITLYKREPSGTWRMARDIWNSSNSPPGVQATGNT